MPKFDVSQIPVDVEFECENCDAENSILYGRFIQRFGEPCEWDGAKVECKECGHINIVEEWEFL